VDWRHANPGAEVTHAGAYTINLDPFLYCGSH
jgi:hypothetical protein